MKKLLIATQNKHKINKIKWIFEDFQFDIRPLSKKDIFYLNQFEEYGETLEDIARKKALLLSIQHPNTIVVATDAGMDIPSLGQQWDKRYTKRFVGETTTDSQRIKQLLLLMQGKKNRDAIWHESIATAENNQILFSKEVVGAKGIIQDSFNPQQYQEGIWLCSLWYFPKFKKNFFEMNPSEQKYAEISWKKLKKSIHDYLLKSGYLRK